MNEELRSREIMARNIRKYMRIKNISRKDVCNDLSLKYTTFTDWINGNNYPRIDKIEIMAKYFGIDKAELIEDNINKKNNITKIPVFDKIASVDFVKESRDIICEEVISEEMAKTGTFFGLKVSGNSMEPNICENDILITKKQSDADSGDTIITMINGKEAVCRRLFKYAEGLNLLSNNTEYSPLYFTNEEVNNLPVEIIGKVVENRRKY